MSTTAMLQSLREAPADQLAARYAEVRRFTEQLVEPLSPEDCTVQSMPDASPTKWHLAHTTWFFEQFVLSGQPGYRPYRRHYDFLFNSYYNSVGKQYSRPQRGLISRPGMDEVRGYREYVDTHVARMIDDGRLGSRLAEIVETGLHHEQQHQELILTDIKHALSFNPLWPVYHEGTDSPGGGPCEPQWVAFPEGTREIGFAGNGFAYDNEKPRHRVFVENFQLASRPVTCGDFVEFIEDGGYRRPELWLSAGWQCRQEHRWESPLYWMPADDSWQLFTLAGLRLLDPAEPVCHVSYFEADAYARWCNARLPTEQEWEFAAEQAAIEGDFVDTLLATDRPIHPRPDARGVAGLTQLFGDVWEWTSSSYAAYPGFRPWSALGEYNGKFMCNQYVLRGGSCATPRDHIRPSYRNFFPPEARWQFSGIRLAR